MTMPCHITDDKTEPVEMMTVREEMERDKLLARVRELMVDDLVEYRHFDWMHYNDSQLEWERKVLASIANYECGRLDNSNDLRNEIIQCTQGMARNIIWPLTCELDTPLLKDLEEQEFRDAWLKGKLT